MSVDEPAPLTGRNRWMLASIGLAIVAAVLLIAIVALILLRPGQKPPEMACSSQSPQAVYAAMSRTKPTYNLAAEGLDNICFFGANLYMPGLASGTATVSVDEVVILAIDVANYDNLGKPGAGSGERDLPLPQPVRLRSGQLINLDLEGCSGCEELTVGLEGGPAE